jgi:hypothetical protein
MSANNILYSIIIDYYHSVVAIDNKHQIQHSSTISKCTVMFMTVYHYNYDRTIILISSE